MGRLIKQGVTGADVRAVQDVLNFHIRRLAPLVVDGSFGPLTHARVMEFQKANQLKPDGIVGPDTLPRLFEEEVLPIGLALAPQRPAAVRGSPLGIQPPRLIPPLTLPPLRPPLFTPFFLPPDSFTRVPPLTPAGQTMKFIATSPVRNDPFDPALASFNQIVQVLNHLPPNFPFRGAIIGAVPKPVKKVGPLALDPVSPMNFGFQWGVKPLFDLKSFGPPVEFAVGGALNARYGLKLIDRPGVLVPQLGLFVQGDFKSTIDWTSEAARSRPQIDMQGAFQLGVEGRF
jgi:hypothetical protein